MSNSQDQQRSSESLIQEVEEFHEEIVTNIAGSPFINIISSGDFIPSSPKGDSSGSNDVPSPRCGISAPATSLDPGLAGPHQSSLDSAGPSTSNAASMPPPSKKPKKHHSSTLHDGLTSALHSVTSAMDTRRNSLARECKHA